MSTAPKDRRQWWILHVVLPVIALGIGAMWLGASASDTRLLDPFFDAAKREFPLRNHWFFQYGLHLGGKYLVIATASVLVILAALGLRNKKPRDAWGRLLYPAVCLLVTVLIAGAWKDLADQGVPPELERFGGSRPGLDEATPRLFGVHLGSPAAHTAGAFAWISLYFVAASLSVRRPAWWLAPGLLLGMLFAVTQHVRGAHVPSHNLWSIAIAWSVAAVMAAVFRRAGLLAWNEPGSVRRGGPIPALRERSFIAEPWLVGVCGFLCGTAFFAIDLVLDEAGGHVDAHFTLFESLEWVLMGPGLGVAMFLLSDRIRTMRERAARRAIAEREDRFRLLGRMAASVAHEVRNPLHTLRLIVDEQRLDVPGLADHPLHGELEACMERIDRAVDLVYRLARPAAEEEEGNADLVRAVHASLEGFERSLPVPWLHEFGRWPESAPVKASDAGLRIVVENLLRNAIEASGPDAPIALDLVSENGSWVLRLTNPGRLTAAYVGNGAAGTLDSEKVDGLGLGMAISRQIVAGAGGSIELREERNSVCCTLRWPAAHADKP